MQNAEDKRQDTRNKKQQIRDKSQEYKNTRVRERRDTNYKI